MDVELSSRLALFIAFGFVASVYACGWMTWRLVKRGQVLEYEPRRRVPWGLGAGLLAILMTTINMVTAIAQRGEANPDPPSAAEFASGVLFTCFLYGGFSVVAVVVLVFLMGATNRDLGWPNSVRQFFGDVGLGVGLGLASLLPVISIQYAAIELLGIETVHPILKQMEDSPEPLVFIVAALAAVVIAPLFEELVFRLLLQGGLERIEDEVIDWPHSRPPSKTEQLIADLEETALGHRIAPGGELLQLAPPPEEIAPVDPRTAGAVVGLSHGWAPILASSFLFALAHLGHGASPIALFVFALILGYAYQRTHRILPSIVAHLVLNLINISMMIVVLV